MSDKNTTTQSDGATDATRSVRISNELWLRLKELQFRAAADGKPEPTFTQLLDEMTATAR